jgi:hypothetical protein
MRLSVILKRGGSTINMEKKASRGSNKEVIPLDMAISVTKICSINSSEEEGEVEDSNTSTFSMVAHSISNSRRRSYLIIQM